MIPAKMFDYMFD